MKPIFRSSESGFNLTNTGRSNFFCVPTNAESKSLIAVYIVLINGAFFSNSFPQNTSGCTKTVLAKIPKTKMIPINVRAPSPGIS